MVLTEDKKEEFKGRFQSIYECNLKIEELNEQIKLYNQSIKDTFEEIAKSLELDSKDKEGRKGIKKGYKEYVDSIKNPSEFDTKETIYSMLKNKNLIGLESQEED